MSTTYITGPTDTYLTAIITHPDTANACYGGGCATPACHCTGAPKYQSNRFVLPPLPHQSGSAADTAPRRRRSR